MGLFVTSVIYTFGFFFDLGWLLVVCTYSYVFFYAISLGAIPFILVTEIFPTKGKSNGKKKQKRERERGKERKLNISKQSCRIGIIFCTDFQLGL